MHFDEVIAPITVKVVTAANFEVGITTKVEHFAVVDKPICTSLAITELLIAIAIVMVIELTVVRIDPTICSLASSVAIVIVVRWSVIEKSTTDARTAIITIEVVNAANSAFVAIACSTVMVT